MRRGRGPHGVARLGRHAAVGRLGEQFGPARVGRPRAARVAAASRRAARRARRTGAALTRPPTSSTSSRDGPSPNGHSGPAGAGAGGPGRPGPSVSGAPACGAGVGPRGGLRRSRRRRFRRRGRSPVSPGRLRDVGRHDRAAVGERRRVERRPAAAGEPRLHPGVGVGGARSSGASPSGVPPVKPTATRAGTPTARSITAIADGELLAVAAPARGEELDERVVAVARRRRQAVGERRAGPGEPLLQRDGPVEPGVRARASPAWRSRRTRGSTPSRVEERRVDAAASPSPARSARPSARSSASCRPAVLAAGRAL